MFSCAVAQPIPSSWNFPEEVYPNRRNDRKAHRALVFNCPFCSRSSLGTQDLPPPGATSLSSKHKLYPYLFSRTSGNRFRARYSSLREEVTSLPKELHFAKDTKASNTFLSEEEKQFKKKSQPFTYASLSWYLYTGFVSYFIWAKVKFRVPYWIDVTIKSSSSVRFRITLLSGVDYPTGFEF